MNIFVVSKSTQTDKLKKKKNEMIDGQVFDHNVNNLSMIQLHHND